MPLSLLNGIVGVFCVVPGLFNIPLFFVEPDPGFGKFSPFIRKDSRKRNKR